MRRATCDMIKSDNRFESVDLAASGEEGLERMRENDYDAIVLDVIMPGVNGLDVLRALQKEKKRQRILVYSTETKEGAKVTLEALELGAVDFMHKPDSLVDTQSGKFATEFCDRLFTVSNSLILPPELFKLAAVIKGKAKPSASSKGTFPGKTTEGASAKRGGKQIVAIASSTGGPKALQAVIPSLPADLAAAVVIVQHMPAGFTASLAERLDQLSPLKVVEAAEDMEIRDGTVYIAPGGRHLHIVKKRDGCFVHLTDEGHREGVKPCANYMYESLAECDYDNVVCVVMTGMGADGTEGITNLKKKKKPFVITQERSTCAVYGMPRAAETKGLSDEVEPLENLASAITKQVGVKNLWM
ncbi:MAG: chemotaxis-specific protein-glutamate methyltransferase CheB [Lachnospiraceae bacterium]|nr:chemotaxis-specific protein-glutamate methyltransferase CheB [Lachnospiraceae bacterium]